MTKLNLSALESAHDRLREALEFSHSEMAKNDNRLFEQFRNSVIQCFEFTYEICCKMMERFLKLETPIPREEAKLGFNDLVREAAQYGLIENPKDWMEYRRARNITSHTYNNKLAQEVYLIASRFVFDAENLLQILKEKNI